MKRSEKFTLTWSGATSPVDSRTIHFLTAGMRTWPEEFWSIPSVPPSVSLPTLTTPIWPGPVAAQLTAKTSQFDSGLKRPDRGTSVNGATSAYSGQAILQRAELSRFITEAWNSLGDLSTIRQSSLKLPNISGLTSNALLSCVGPATRSLFEAIRMKSSTPNFSPSTASHVASQERLTRDEMFIEMAHTAAKRGTCNRLKVGAVIALDSRPISMGYNGTPPGAAHCGPECTMDNPCTKTLHAEANAIHWAQKNEPTYGAYGATIYVTDSPCKACAILIHLAGISRVVYDRAYRIRDGIEYLESHGIEVIQCHVKPATNAN